MSEAKWYENLSSKELPGKHVHVVLSNATMDGCLNLHGEIPYWAEDDDLKYVQILEQGHDRVWRTAVGVESVSLVWDERDWERIEAKDMLPGDVAVVGGRLIWGGVISGSGSLVSGSAVIPLEMVSCALRCKSKLPTEPGFYRSDSVELLYLADHSGWWWLFGPHGPSHLSLPFADLMPLTPVHFVDGRAE